jgi:hypothetical protein
MKPPLRNFLQAPIMSSIFGPNVLPNTLFSNIPSPCSSLKTPLPKVPLLLRVDSLPWEPLCLR